MFQLLVESVRDYAIFMLDPSGHVATWNQGAERIKGYRADEIIGRHFSTFYPIDDVRSGKCEMELEVAEREGRFEDEGWRLRKDGSMFWALVVINAMRDTDGTLLGFAKITRDLTERKRAEDDRAARLAAEQANRAKDEFLAMLGHELRNPLAPIATALQLMRLRGETASREQQVIDRQVKHMIRLVDDLLDVSRMMRGKIELHVREIDARDAIAKAVEQASPLLEQRRMHLEIDVARAEDLSVHADEARLAQVFANVLSNAAKYTQAGGNVALRARRDGGEVVVEIRDDGIGIPPELLTHVFEPFVQGTQGSDRSCGGLGIGLALARRLVELQGGRIEADSAGTGAGSTFTIVLPAAVHRIEASPHPNGGVDVATRPRKVLVVDDNPDALSLLGEALASAGHDVRTAADPAIALQIVRHFTPDIAVLDIGLPVMDGYELAARLRDELGASAPHMIALTGYGQPSDRERSERAGFAAHFVKPVDLVQLGDRIVTLAA